MKNSDRLLPAWLTGGIIVAAFVTLTGLELRRALRREREPKVRRVARNLAIAAIGGVVTALVEQPVVAALAPYARSSNWGLVNAFPLPALVRTTAAILLLDYTLYIWHVLTHKVPLLWRFHLPHHIDLDCDASTAIRFHFGELLLSVPFRALQIALIGASVRDYSLWQTLLFVSILFHHSNVELSPEWDRRLSRIIVTPRMHGIHHDAMLEHADSNWSSGLSVWDRLHGTLQLGVPQQEVIIGVPAYQDPHDVTIEHVLAMPFTDRRDDWQPPRAELSGQPGLGDGPADARQPGA